MSFLNNIPTTAGTGYYTSTANTMSSGQPGNSGGVWQAHKNQPSYSIGSSGTANSKPAITVNSGSHTINNATINAASQYNVQFNNATATAKGSMRFDTINGNMEAFDGTDWVIIAGLDGATTRLDRVNNVLLVDYPEVLADLVLRGDIE